MTNTTLVSIALCAYNGEKYIGQQIESILAQTYHNLEIVIVDDCSTDSTLNIIKSFARKDARIKYFTNEVNLGFNKNFEHAIKLTTGPYIAISDQDDIWLPGKIAALLSHINDNWVIFSNSSFTGDIEHGEILHNFNMDANNYKSILLANFVTGHTTLFKRQFMDVFLPFPEKGFYDWWMGFVALYHRKITFLDQALTQYRIHSDSVMQNRINSGKEKQQEVQAIYHMLSAFASYKELEEKDKLFIKRLQDAYEKGLSGKFSMPLVELVVNNYRELFANQKARKGLSLLNFAIKYTRKVKKYS